jgi:hypothetical protein
LLFNPFALRATRPDLLGQSPPRIMAEGETKIALAKCEAMEGDAQKQCRGDANAHLQAVKDRAKEAKRGPLQSLTRDNTALTPRRRS